MQFKVKKSLHFWSMSIFSNIKNQFYRFDGSYLYIRARKSIALDRALLYARHAQCGLKYIIETTLKMFDV